LFDTLNYIFREIHGKTYPRITIFREVWSGLQLGLGLGVWLFKENSETEG